MVRSSLRTAAVLLLSAVLSPAARLTPPARRALETYAAGVETRLAGQHASPDTYLAVLGRDGNARTDVERELLAGAIRVEPVNGGTWQVSGGLLHHWRAAAFVPGATAPEMLALLRDFGSLARHYAPEVVSARALATAGDRATLAMRFRKHRIITVVLDAEFETHSTLTGAGNAGYSVSRSTHIWQVDRPGSPQERRRPEGDDDGFLWGLNSSWSFEETHQGLLIECEAVSLTRDIPATLGWLITPIIRTLPRTSLEFTLTATKNSLLANSTRRRDDDRAK
jgi:hypothetical protein